jgi:hypothetical protein
MPGEDGVGADDGGEIGEDSATQQLPFRCQPTALVIGQPEPFSAELFSQNPVFFLQVTDDGCWSRLTQPAAATTNNCQGRIVPNIRRFSVG